MPYGLYDSTTNWYNDLHDMNDHGMGLVRWNSDMWSLIEVSSNVWDWSKMDSFIEIATSTFNMDIVVIMPIAASWTPVTGGCPKTVTGTQYLYGVGTPFSLTIGQTHCPASDKSLIKRFAKTFATRYCSSADKIFPQAWNEEDNTSYWKGEMNPSTQDYLDQAYEPIYDGIKEGCPAMKVMMGGIYDPRGAFRNLVSTDNVHMLEVGYTHNFYVWDLMEKIKANGTCTPDYVAMHVYSDFMWATMSEDYKTFISIRKDDFESVKGQVI
jgi:hypothetical protein